MSTSTLSHQLQQDTELRGITPDRGPLRIMFLLTSMPIGGAETLLVNLIRRLDASRFVAEVGCMKASGPLGEELAQTIPVHSHLIKSKFDVTVVPRLARLLRNREIDAVITVGCGDKMFWGRLAAWQAGVSVIGCALHSTGWPDGVGRMNRLLTGITDAFIGVADAHGDHLVRGEGFPAEKVHVIPNGIDTKRFHARRSDVSELRQSLGLPDDGPIATIVAALRPEKNHQRFLESAKLVSQKFPKGQFVIVGDGPIRGELEESAHKLKINDVVHFLGSRHDIPEILRASDVFVLTSDNEAAPVSILEAMASGLPVVSSDVGSIHEMVKDKETGFLVPLQAADFADRLLTLFGDFELAQTLGAAGRKHVETHGSLEVMVRGYEDLIQSIYDSKVLKNDPR